MFKQIYNRIYSDFFLPNRLKYYEEILLKSIENGYEHMSIFQFYKLVKSNQIKKGQKIFINRHDIDTDIETAKRFFLIEKKYNIYSSYYFRLSTLDIALMQKIQDFGSEASYHFEELSSFIKKKKLKSKTEILNNIEHVKNEFVNNFISLEEKLGYKMQTISSHGDFINRKLSLSNSLIIDQEVKNKLGILVETYENDLLNQYSIIISDKQYPQSYDRMSPIDAIDKGYDVIYLLSHPRHWYCNISENLKENLKRMIEGIKYT